MPLRGMAAGMRCELPAAGTRRGILVAVLAVLAAGCTIIPEHVPPPAPIVVPPPPPANALSAGVTAGPDIATLGLGAEDTRAALAAFRDSCPRLMHRGDSSGLTQPADWQSACAAAANWPDASASDFFTASFETAVVGPGTATVTGYYEPEIAGARSHLPGFDVPVYGPPPDLVHARPGDAPIKPNGMTPFGRYDANGRFGPYFERAQIEQGALAGQGLEIAWVQDPVAFFFMQIQGSGRLRGPDGSVMRIGYAADNGHDYTGIGTIMRQQGLIGTGPGQYPASMQGIVRYLHDQPVAGQALMDQNKSWVFFREIIGDGPIGALGVPVRRHVSLAADPLFVPLGAPVVLRMDPALAGATAANGLWVAQDTGGAIKGANRFDSFWGSGADGQAIAGGLYGHGQALILLPRGTLARLGVARPAPAYAPPAAYSQPAPYAPPAPYPQGAPYAAPSPYPQPVPYAQPGWPRPADPSISGPPLDSGAAAPAPPPR